MPEHAVSGDVEQVSLIDGSVLVNAPFAEAMAVLRDRPAQREVDRRFVYIDPRPDRVGGLQPDDPRPPGWFSVIFGSLSSIPREQPIRDNLEVLAAQSREMARLQSIVGALRPEVEESVEKALGHTLFLDRPTPKRLKAWRDKSHEAARRKAGFAWHAYLEVKVAGIVETIATLVCQAVPELPHEAVLTALEGHLQRQGLGRLASPGGLISPDAVTFLRSHDLAFRIRRLRLLARRLSQEWDGDPEVSDEARHEARDAVYRALSLYFDREPLTLLGADFAEAAAKVVTNPAAVFDILEKRRQLPATDLVVDALLAEALGRMVPALRRKVLLSYLGFPWFDAVTLPLLRGEGLTEFDPVKVDRISPDDCSSIRPGGTNATLRGVEFYNFGAFFSRAYRENDYLWGRLHGAERMIDLVSSALPGAEPMTAQELKAFKREAFLAILTEEEKRLKADPGLVAGIRAEVEKAMA